MTYSFDVFDTCLVRKCGTAYNMVDVLSTMVFKTKTEEWQRQEFVVSRIKAEQQLSIINPSGTIYDLYDLLAFDWDILKPKKELIQIEIELEDKLLVPVLSVRDEISCYRNKGNKIIFLSDMYLPSHLILKKLKEYGLFIEGDSLYVSCEYGKTKHDGQLFELVLREEGLSKRTWKHVGDNPVSDYETPRSIGIKAELKIIGYNKYPSKWIESDFSLGYKYKKIIAGLSRALFYSNANNSHTAILCDVIAPLYCSWVYLLLKDAQAKGINRLLFCARDAFIIHKIAVLYNPLFPTIDIDYICISREAVYNNDNIEAKLSYFKRVGLATNECHTALVDITSSGRMLAYVNKLLSDNGYNQVYQYLFSLWHQPDSERNYYRVFNYDDYVKLNFREIGLASFNWMIYESYFSLNNEVKTHDYKFEKGHGIPVKFSVSESDECELRTTDDYYIDSHNKILLEYAKSFVELNLYHYSDKIFDNIAIPSLVEFFRSPCPQYVNALSEYYVSWGGA